MGEKVIASISAFSYFFFPFYGLHVPSPRKKQFVVISLRFHFHRTLARPTTVIQYNIRIYGRHLKWN